MSHIKNQNPDQNTQKKEIIIERGKQIPCSLLIPEQLLSALHGQLKQYSSMNEFISDLVHQFGHLPGQADLYNNHLTTRYQDQDQSLQKFNFRIKPEIWHSLKLLARNRGISICFLFVQFLLFLVSALENFTPSRQNPSVSIQAYYYTESLEEFLHKRSLTILKRPGNLPPP